MLGLSGSEYFCRMFKKYTGISPRVYRKNKQSDLKNEMDTSD